MGNERPASPFLPRNRRPNRRRASCIPECSALEERALLNGPASFRAVALSNLRVPLGGVPIPQQNFINPTQVIWNGDRANTPPDPFPAPRPRPPAPPSTSPSPTAPAHDLPVPPQREHRQGSELHRPLPNGYYDPKDPPTRNIASTSATACPAAGGLPRPAPRRDHHLPGPAGVVGRRQPLLQHRRATA